MLSVLHQWVKNHWYDFENDPTLLEALERFLQMSCDQKLTNQHKKFCKNIIVSRWRNWVEAPSASALLSILVRFPARLLASAAFFQTLIEKKQKQQESEGHVNTAFDFEDTNNAFQPKKPEVCLFEKFYLKPYKEAASSRFGTLPSKEMWPTTTCSRYIRSRSADRWVILSHVKVFRSS